MGRKQKPYQTTWHEIIPGLSKDYDGRWRIIATGKRFVEADERLAVQKFRQWESENGKQTMAIQIPLAPMLPPAPNATGWDVVGTSSGDDIITPQTYTVDTSTGKSFGTFQIDESAIFNAVRNLIINDPILAAKKIGIPEIAHLRNIKIPQEIRLTDLLSAYLSRQKHPQTRRNTVKVFGEFVEFTKFKTLADINVTGLMVYRDSVESSNLGAATKKQRYAIIRTVIAKNLKYGIDATQISAALAKLKVLFTEDMLPQVNPQPISKENFHKLLNAATTKWKAILLISLNCCLHLGECLELRWAELNTEKKTYACIRAKTKRHNIPRCAVLWPETVDILQQLPKTQSEYVFTSTHGTKHNRQCAGDLFASLRRKAGVADTVKFDAIRDGAFTAACRVTDGLQLARLLGGHSNGMADHYVLRSPEIVKPACDAVYTAYMEN